MYLDFIFIFVGHLKLEENVEKWLIKEKLSLEHTKEADRRHI